MNYEGRKWDGDKGTELVDAPLSFKIASVTHGLEMDMNKEPEDGIPTPTEMLTDLLFGTPQEYDAAILHLNEKSAEKYGRPKIIKETTEAVKVSATAQ